MTLNLTTRYYASSRDMAFVDTNNADLKAREVTFNKDYGSTTDKSYKPTAGHDLIWSPTTAQRICPALSVALHKQSLLKTKN